MSDPVFLHYNSTYPHQIWCRYSPAGSGEPHCFHFPYPFLLWNCKINCEPRKKFFCPMLSFLTTVKTGQSLSNTNTIHPIASSTCATYIPTISLISIGGFLRINVKTLKVPICTTVKFQFFAPPQKIGEGSPYTYVTYPQLFPLSVVAHLGDKVAK